MIHCIAHGRITRDAELRHTSSGSPVLNFTVACDPAFGKGDASFLDCALWGSRAEKLAEYLVKGKAIIAVGYLKQEKWETDGQKRSKMKLSVDNVQFTSGNQQSEPSRAPAAAMPIGPARVDVDDDEIPF